MNRVSLYTYKFILEDVLSLFKPLAHQAAYSVPPRILIHQYILY